MTWIKWTGVAAAALVAGLAGSPAQAGLLLTGEAPGVQTSQVSGVTTETFESFATGSNYTSLNTAVGTITGTDMAIVAADRFGGAGGTGKYFAIGAQSGGLDATLAVFVGGAQSYLGFWWSAADPGNFFELYSGNQLLATFNPSSALGALTNASYFGNPTSNFSGQNSGEKYVYLNIYGTDGTTFDKIVFRNQSTSTGFEVDNISIKSTPVTPPPGGELPGLNVVPEPSTLASALLASVVCAVVAHRRRGARVAA